MIFPTASFRPITLEEANALLVRFGHRMGPLRRGDKRGWCHALFEGAEPVGVVTTSYLIRERVGGGLGHLTRADAVELSRLCAARPDLCRVVLRMWREFVFPALPFAAAISYQDAAMHTGGLYRHDGWGRSPRKSSSGTDPRARGGAGRRGRDKWVWVWPAALVEPAAEPVAEVTA